MEYNINNTKFPIPILCSSRLYIWIGSAMGGGWAAAVCVCIFVIFGKLSFIRCTHCWYYYASNWVKILCCVFFTVYFTCACTHTASIEMEKSAPILLCYNRTHTQYTNNNTLNPIQPPTKSSRRHKPATTTDGPLLYYTNTLLHVARINKCGSFEWMGAFTSRPRPPHTRTRSQPRGCVPVCVIVI